MFKSFKSGIRSTSKGIEIFSTPIFDEDAHPMTTGFVGEVGVQTRKCGLAAECRC